MKLSHFAVLVKSNVSHVGLLSSLNGRHGEARPLIRAHSC
jgi:hypothetical protein